MSTKAIAAAALFLMASGVAIVVFGAFVAAVDRRADKIRNREAWAKRPRAKILRVGSIVETYPRPTINGWSFDGQGVVPALQLGPDGETAIGGYTIEELREIHARRSEFAID